MTDAAARPAPITPAPPTPVFTPANDLLIAARNLARSKPIEGAPRGRCDVVPGPDGYTITAFVPTQRTDTPTGELVTVVEFSQPAQ